MNGKNDNRMTVAETATLFGVSPQCIRVGLENGAFTFGTVVRMKRKVYIIWRSEVERLTGKGRTNGGGKED